jgi:ADP-heptose:LPS heptosyltransferase
MGQKFLISKLSSLGDVVCSLPAAAALKRGFPDCAVTWVVDPRFADVVECCSAVDEVVRAKPGFSPKAWPKLDGPFDAALDLQGLSKSAIVVARAKAELKVGYHRQREGAWLFSERVLPDPSSQHIVDQYVDVARAVGGVANEAEFALAPKPADLDSVREKLKARGVDGPFAVLNPGAGWVSKRWPAEHCASLVALLADQGLATVLIGGRAEKERSVVAEVVALCSRPAVDLAGETSVGELIALVSLCAVHVGGDTGSSHIAGALGRPAAGLFSGTRPERYCPYGQIQRCLHEPGGLAAISPERVAAVVASAL